MDLIDDDKDELPAEPGEKPVRGMASSPSKPNAYRVAAYLASTSAARASSSQQPQDNSLEHFADEANNKVSDLARYYTS